MSRCFEPGSRLSSGGVENYLGSIDPQGVAVQFLLVAERHQRQRDEQVRQMLVAVSEVGFQILDVLQGVESFVLDFPAAASYASQFAGVVGVDRQVG